MENSEDPVSSSNIPTENQIDPDEKPTKGKRSKWLLITTAGILALILIAAVSAFGGYRSGISIRQGAEATQVVQVVAEQYEMGVQDMQSGAYQRARQRFEYVIQLDPNYPGVTEKLADVLVMPYRKCEVTKSMQPLKLLEYLATDKPVVCTDLPALNAWGDCCDVVSNSDFACRVCEVYERGLTESQKNNRNRRLPNESWQNKARMLEIMIDTPLEASVSMSGTVTRAVHE